MLVHRNICVRLRRWGAHGLLDPAMVLEGIFSRLVGLAGIIAFAVLFSCLHGCVSYEIHNDNETAVGEEHEVNFPAEQTFVMTQDVLRGQGVLFDVKPEQKIDTLWKPADVPVGLFSGLAGHLPQYRYEIAIADEGGRRSKIIVNVRTENVPPDQIGNYKATTKLNLFNDFDQLAATLPPAPLTPGSGGVNFALLPGEDLAALSKRVTGNPDNWPQIAKDNGLKSMTDTGGVQSVWIANSLIPKTDANAPHRAGATP
jgi:hypothetical protein